MSKLLSLARFSSDVLFGFLFQGIDYKWTVRDHLLVAGLFTFSFLVTALGCIVFLSPHGHDYPFAFKSGAGAFASGLVALHSWNQWLVKRRAA